MGRLCICVVHMLFWVVLSGHFNKFFLFSGVVCSIFAVTLHRKLSTAIPSDGYSAHPNPQSVHPCVVAKNLFQYCFWLGWQIILSAFFVTKMVFRSRGACTPVITTISVPHDNGLEMFMLTNSVTATPGTVGMQSMPDFRVRILALDRSLLDGVIEISRKVRRVFYA